MTRHLNPSTVAALLLLFTSSLLFSSNLMAEQETPKEGLQAIISLYQSGDFDRLIKERYNEIHKAEAVGKVDELIARFSKRLAHKNRLDQVVQIYQSALDVTPELTENPYPQITETDQMAVFDVDGFILKLYLQKTGRWGFHM